MLVQRGNLIVKRRSDVIHSRLNALLTEGARVNIPVSKWYFWTESLRWLTVEILSPRTYAGRSYSFGDYLVNRILRKKCTGARRKAILRLVLGLGFRKKLDEYYDAAISSDPTELPLDALGNEELHDLRRFCVSQRYAQHFEALPLIDTEIEIRRAAHSAVQTSVE